MTRRKDLCKRIVQLEDCVNTLQETVILQSKKILDLTERVDKNHNSIKALIELCEPIIIERLSGLVGEIANGLEQELKRSVTKSKKQTKQNKEVKTNKKENK